MIPLIRSLLFALAMALPIATRAQEPAEKSSQPGQFTISVQALIESKVLDRDNREVGTIKNLMVDPNTGKIASADIALGSQGFLGITRGDNRVSVPWEKLSVRRQNGSLVLVMNEQFLGAVQGGTKDKQAGSQAAGASVEDIRKAEEALKARGLDPGPVDGKIDDRTQQAIREFQKQNNLTVTGSMDQQTADKLGVKIGSQPGTGK